MPSAFSRIVHPLTHQREHYEQVYGQEQHQSSFSEWAGLSVET